MYATASKEAAIASYEKTLQVAFKEVADALSDKETIDAKIAALSASVSAAERAANISDERYKVGVISYINNQDTHMKAYSAYQDLVNARLERANNQIFLYRSLAVE